MRVPPNGIFNGLAVFACLSSVTNTERDRHSYTHYTKRQTSVAIGRMHAMRLLAATITIAKMIFGGYISIYPIPFG